MSYERECEEFEKWFRQENARIEAIASSGILDGRQSKESVKFNREAYKKIKEIEEKYNKKYAKTIGEILYRN